MTSSDQPPDDEPPIPPREDTQPIPVQPGTGAAGGAGAFGDLGGEGGPGGSGDVTGAGGRAGSGGGSAGAGAPPSEPVGVRTEPAQGPFGGRAGWVGLVAVGLLTLLVAAFLLVNAVVAGNAEREAEAEATAALGAPATVRLQGFPVGIRLLLGAPIDGRLHARDVPLEGTEARLTSLEIDAVDVVVERGGQGALTASRATFVAELDEEAVRDLVGIVGRIPLTAIELANGVARLSVAGFALIDATADVEGGQVVFRLTSPLGNLDFLGRFSNVPLELDALPLGFEVTEVEIRRGVLRLRGATTDLRLEGDAAG